MIRLLRIFNCYHKRNSIIWPDDILMFIFERLPFRALINIKLVCKRFYMLYARIIKCRIPLSMNTEILIDEKLFTLFCIHAKKVYSSENICFLILSRLCRLIHDNKIRDKNGFGWIDIYNMFLPNGVAEIAGSSSIFQKIRQEIEKCNKSGCEPSIDLWEELRIQLNRLVELDLWHGFVSSKSFVISMNNISINHGKQPLDKSVRIGKTDKFFKMYWVDLSKCYHILRNKLRSKTLNKYVFLDWHS